MHSHKYMGEKNRKKEPNHYVPYTVKKYLDEFWKMFQKAHLETLNF
jgi:hypothetical protein